jgi:tRNA A-37 threonylcarbamoyl transferase component Bud32
MPSSSPIHDPDATTNTAPATPGRMFRRPAWDWVDDGATGWWVRPGWREALLGPNGLRLDEWRREGRLTTVKTGPHRAVYRVDLPAPAGGVFVKHNLVPNLRARLRQWFRRGKSRNEARRAELLAGVGVPTITPVALGERRRRGFLLDNFLVTRALDDYQPLDRFVEHGLHALAPNRRARVRRLLAVELGVLTARLHQAGFVHIDFHAGNLLVGLGPDDRPRLAMIDLDALRTCRRLGDPAAIENLALLNHYFWIRSSRSDRMRFVRAYLAARGREPGESRPLAKAVEKSTRDWAERLWRRWGRRCLGTNKYFRSQRGPTAWAVSSRELDPGTVRRLLINPDAPFHDPDAVLLKDSRTTRVAVCTLSVEGRPTPVIYKRFNRKKLLDPIYTLFRPSRAWRAWQNGQHLLSRGVPTPTNLAVIGSSSRRPRLLPHQYWPHDTYLVTRKAEPAITVGEFARKVLPSLSPRERQGAIRRIAPALGGLLRLLHERSLSHRDLKADNILIEGPIDAPAPSLTLIDLVGVRIEFPISRHHQVQNLARLQLSLASAPGRTRADAVRFLRAYLPWALLPRDEWKKLWREVEHACLRKQEQNIRNNRVLS